MVVPRPPVVPVRRMGEAGGAIVAFDSREKTDESLGAEIIDCVQIENDTEQRQCAIVFMYA